AWIIFGIWNAVNDPLFGYISDKTKSKIGRRLPYIRYGSLFYSLFFIITWFKWPIGSGQISMFIQLLAALFLFDTLYTAIATSLYVLPYTMAVSNKARSNIFIWKICFSIISLAFPLVVVPLIQPKPGEPATKFRVIVSCIGILAFIIIFSSTFFIKEKVTTPPDDSMNIFKSIAYCFKNKSFIVFEVLSFSVIFIQTNLLQGVNYYFAEFGNNLMPVAYGALGIGAVLGLLTWMNRLKPWGVRKCILIMCILFASGATAMVFFGKIFPVAVAGFFLAGLGFAGGMYLVPIMNGDVIDYDEHKFGQRREGMYAGVNSFITKPAISLSNAAFVEIISLFGYNSASVGAQSETAKQGILVAWMAIPALLLIITAVSLKWYPLHGEKWNSIKSEIEIKHNHT
ncbi:MAG: MFS transporter, partial [Clostridia bacterium]|nr:MFS transporter [Clostridia bacterium]